MSGSRSSRWRVSTIRYRYAERIRRPRLFTAEVADPFGVRMYDDACGLQSEVCLYAVRRHSLDSHAATTAPRAPTPCALPKCPCGAAEGEAEGEVVWGKAGAASSITSLPAMNPNRIPARLTLSGLVTNAAVLLRLADKVDCRFRCPLGGGEFVIWNGVPRGAGGIKWQRRRRPSTLNTTLGELSISDNAAAIQDFKNRYRQAPMRYSTTNVPDC